MDRTIFEVYVRTQFVQTAQEGNIVILDNQPAHKSPARTNDPRAGSLAAVSVISVALPACAKLGAQLRAMAMRSIDELRKAMEQICDLFAPEERATYFEVAGYGFK